MQSKPKVGPPDPSAGRPFSASDLATGKERLKKSSNLDADKQYLRGKSVDAGKQRPYSTIGLAGVFSSAIDSRRKAVADSESDESEFEDVDEEWNDD